MLLAAKKSGLISDMPKEAEEDEGRRSINLELTIEAGDTLDQLAKEFGMVKKVLLSRIVEWWAGQHEGVQKLATNRLIRGYELVALKAIVRHLETSQGGTPKETPSKRDQPPSGAVGNAPPSGPPLPAEQPPPARQGKRRN